MINNDRIVPVTKTDLLTLYGMIMKQSFEGDLEILSGSIEGDYVVSETADGYFADAPVKTLDFADGVTTGLVYFVATDDYQGVKLAGVNVDAAEGSDTVEANGQLYSASLADGAVSIVKIGF